VLLGSGLTLEEAGVLMDLYTSADKDGFVPYAALRARSCAAFSRQIALLRKAKLVKSRRLCDGAAQGGRVSKTLIAVGLTEAGVARIESVHDRYCTACEKLLRDLAQEDQLALLQICTRLVYELEIPT